MKRLGLLGGMSWESTAVYYRLLNEGVRARRGGLASAELLLWSFDFADVARRQTAGDWKGLGDDLRDAARKLQQAGADGIILCCNTMHLPIDRAVQALTVPFIHIVDVAAEAVTAAGLQRPLLLGSRFTMQQPFYRERLQRFGLTPVTPVGPDFDLIDRIIYDELCRGRVEAASRQAAAGAIERARVGSGADSVILGCTELGLLVRPADVSVPVFDTTELHVHAALRFMFEADEPATTAAALEGKAATLPSHNRS